ncbi:MAG: fused MFS/spermidine synthase [Candidatus Adiutrix sp.]|jgi:spermidine synthase|nr:fused MFS/spermidine synthase [Candidatus Adiutrix sp.]
MSGLIGKLTDFVRGFGPNGQAFSSLRAEVIFEGDSEFHHIIIMEENGRRTMFFGPAGEEAETSVDLRNPDQAVFEYPGMMLAALPLMPQGRRIAMLGLGGGYLPRLFRRYLPQYFLTVVEVDLMVAELAETYFGFSPGDNVRLVVSDGRDFLEAQKPGAFDQIWLDAFSGDYVPSRLSGPDFLELCLSRLAPGGLLAQNLHQSRPAAFSRQLDHTRAVFGDFMGLSGVRCGNAIIVARAPGAETGPPWKPAALSRAAKDFGPRIGPYDLVREMGKFKKFGP